MLQGISARLAALVVPLVLAACDPVTGEPRIGSLEATERGSVTMTPERLATLRYREAAPDLVCDGGRVGVPATIGEASLQPGEVGAGFHNWSRGEKDCRRPHTTLHEGLVGFDLEPLYDIGAFKVRRATLRFRKRPLSLGGTTVRSLAPGLPSAHCPDVRSPLGAWQAGFRDLPDASALVETRPLADAGPARVGFPTEAEVAVEVTEEVDGRLAAGEPLEFALLSTSELSGQDNGAFCFVILGDFELELEFDRVPEPAA